MKDDDENESEMFLFINRHLKKLWKDTFYYC